MNNLTHGSLFSGIGGFDLAAEWAGFENLFHCEWNPFGRRVLEYYFPNSKSYDDIKQTDFSEWRGEIDILSGGFPCQPFSCAGRRKGAKDDRYLWDEMLRAIKEIRPSWVIGENVAGLLSMVFPGEEIEVGVYQDAQGENHTETEIRERFIIDKICQDLEEIGYTVQPFIIPACAVGAPHRRDRIWFVAENTVSIRCDREIREKESCIRRFGEPCTRDYERIHSKENASNSILRRCDRRSEETIKRQEALHSGERIFCKTERFGKGKNVANPESTESKGECKYKQRKTQLVGRNSKNIQTDWHDFPTQSPVCNRNDGFSLGLAGISFPKWRQEAIKSLGNAIVPQVAYEIFKSIKRISHETKNHPNQRD